MRLLSSRPRGAAQSEAAGAGDFGCGWWPPRLSTLAPILAVLSCVLFCCNGELLQALQRHTGGGGGASPLFNLTLCHLGGLLFAPHFLQRDEAAKGEISPAITGGPANSPRFVALFFSFLIMGYNYAWLLSAKLVPMCLTNAVFQTSVAFVYLASTSLFSEPLTFPRLIGVALSLLGSALASGVGDAFVARPLHPVPVSAPHASSTSAATATGVLLALLAALGLTVYQVLFKHMYGHLKGDWRFLAYFGAWVSVWHVLAILPLVVLASQLGVEPLEIPTGRAAVAATMASAAIASTVNALNLCIVMWGSPMLLPCSSALSVPLTVALDAAFHGARPSPVEFLGHLMVVVSVVLIMELYTSGLAKAKTMIAGDSLTPNIKMIAV